jgi:hypothetical protein
MQQPLLRNMDSVKIDDDLECVNNEEDSCEEDSSEEDSSEEDSGEENQYYISDNESGSKSENNSLIYSLSSSSEYIVKVENETTNTPLNENIIITPGKDLCIICFCDESSKEFFDLDSSNNCRKQCRCRVIIHKECFEDWYDRSETCPLCRKEISYTTPLILCCRITKKITICFYRTLTLIVCGYVFISLLFNLSKSSFI